MSTAIRISHKLADDAKVISNVENRSVTGQIEYWAKIGKIAEENKDDLKGIFVQKFKIDNLQYLLSYIFKKDLIELVGKLRRKSSIKPRR